MKTQRVRVKLVINANGTWAAYGRSDATEDDVVEELYIMMGGAETETARPFYLIADIPVPEPLPKPVEIDVLVENAE